MDLQKFWGKEEEKTMRIYRETRSWAGMKSGYFWSSCLSACKNEANLGFSGGNPLNLGHVSSRI